MEQPTQNTRVCWASIDPMRKRVDMYPKHVALRCEKSYGERDKWEPQSCVLGSDFFNATVHFHPSGSLYQTTPGLSMGRAGFKQPGYRSVMRIAINDEHTDASVYTIYSKQVHGEWRNAYSQEDSETTFEETIAQEFIIDSDANSNIAINTTSWKPEDLDSDSLDTSVVVWQWCRGTPEKNGNIMALGKEWWIPYLYEQNTAIESDFSQSSQEAHIVVPFDNSNRTIQFTYGSCYAVQKDASRHRIRQVRRIVVSVQELKEMLDRMNQPLCPSMLTQITDPDTIPHEFYCCISQDIMVDPVKTIDSFTYDRTSIERWFQNSSKSPLTGLSLLSKALVPNTDLKDQIDKFLLESIASLNISAELT